jgi:acyl-CoA dehydrogenase
MDLSPSPEDSAIADAVRSFVEREVLPHEPVVLQRAAAGGPDDLTPEELRSLQDKARESGLWGVATPEEYGGAGLSKLTQTLIAVELGRTFLQFYFGGTAFDSLFLLNDSQKQKYLYPCLSGELRACFAMSEPGGGSDARGIRTTAERDGDHWVINGEKLWISHGNDADFAITFARTAAEGASGGITAFLVDRSMGWTSSPYPVMGSYKVAQLSFRDVRVPDANVIGQVGEGFQTVALASFHANRIVMTAGMAGAMERLLEMAVTWSENRVTFGEPLAQRENVRWMIADGEVACRATKLLCLHAASLYDAGTEFRHAANSAKLFGARAACQVADDVLQIHGAMGYAKELPVERFYRDLRVNRIYEGTDEMQRLAISRDLFKRHVKVGQLW